MLFSRKEKQITNEIISHQIKTRGYLQTEIKNNQQIKKQLNHLRIRNYNTQ